MDGVAMRHFKDSEFACQCCGKVLINPKFADMLDHARHLAERPFVVTSGYRCRSHNANVGAQPTSSHIFGMAADIKINSEEDRWVKLKAMLEAGFTRIGIGKDFIHVDCDSLKNSNRVWVY